MSLGKIFFWIYVVIVFAGLFGFTAWYFWPTILKLNTWIAILAIYVVSWIVTTVLYKLTMPGAKDDE